MQRIKDCILDLQMCGDCGVRLGVLMTIFSLLCAASLQCFDLILSVASILTIGRVTGTASIVAIIVVVVVV